MILDELVLHNYGVYRGRQELILRPPSPSKPIVLIGGMNGCGKTTLLDALQLALFGKLGRCSNRNGLGYDEFLRRSIHRDENPKDGAGLELEFRHVKGGEERTYRVFRYWRASRSRVSEDLEVHVDGRPDPVLAEQWLEHVESLMPSRIAHLFFFDGEKIEALADVANSADLLSTAIHSLLGLDVVDRLSEDLVVLARKKRAQTESRQPGRASRVDELEKELRAAEELLRAARQRRAAAKVEHESAVRDLRGIEKTFREKGGDLYQERRSIESKRDGLLIRIRDLEEELRSLAASSIPLVLVGDLLEKIKAQVTDESRADQDRVVGAVLKERDEAALVAMMEAGAPKKAQAALRRFFDQDLEQRSQSREEPYLSLTSDGAARLRSLEPELSSGGENLVALLRDLDRAQADLVAVERKLAGVPAPEAIQELVEKKELTQRLCSESEGKLAAIDDEIRRFEQDVERRSGALSSEIDRKVDSDLAHEDTERIIDHASRVRTTLGSFREQVVARHTARIEKLVLDSLHELLRKEDLVTGIRINPKDYTLSLMNGGRAPLPPERLSAGERQLLAVSMLWGLARASGRPLPVIVDTPLGRLDSSHRSHLVERYFPKASHQVILLSTDEEIDQKYLPKIRPRVGHSYQLDFNDTTGCTTVRPGYFWK